MFRGSRYFFCVMLLVIAPLIAADDDADDSASSKGGNATYLPLKPTFVVNYGGKGRLRYLKADLSVRLEDAAAANSVRHHLPYIRNNLVMLFASQTDASLESQAGKEALRREALAEVRAVLEEEDGRHGVVDIYFDNFVIQR